MLTQLKSNIDNQSTIIVVYNVIQALGRQKYSRVHDQYSMWAAPVRRVASLIPCIPPDAEKEKQLLPKLFHHILNISAIHELELEGVDRIDSGLMIVGC